MRAEQTLSMTARIVVLLATGCAGGDGAATLVPPDADVGRSEAGQRIGDADVGGPNDAEVVSVDAAGYDDAGSAGALRYAGAVPSGEALLQIVERITAEGQRLPGWPASVWVEAYLADELTALGAEEVTRQPVPNTRFWMPGPASLEVVGTAPTLAVYPLVYNPGTGGPDSFVEGELVEYDGEAQSVGGKVVLLDFRLPRMTNQALFCQRAAWCRDPDRTLRETAHLQPSAHKSPTAPVLEALLRRTGADAPAAVLANLVDYWDNERFIGSWRNGRDRFDETTPAGWIRGSTGETLRAAMGRGSVRVRVRMPVAVGGRTTHNVFGTLPALPGRPTVLISTHHDAPFAGGVEDASGVAVVLGSARYWSRVPVEERPFRLLFYFASAHFDGRRGTRTFIEGSGALENVALSLAFEHGGREAVVQDGALRVLNRDEPRWLYVSPAHLDRVEAAVVAEDRRRVIADVPTEAAPPLGDGYDFWRIGIPIVHHVSVPVYLFSEEDTAMMVEPTLDAWVRVFARTLWAASP